MAFRKQILLWCGIAVAGAIFLNGIDIFVQWFAVSPNGSDSILLVEMWLILPLLFVLLIALGSPFLLIPSKTRKVALVMMLSGILFLVITSIFRIGLGNRVRMHGFHKLAERSVPLVQAIHRFEKEKGYPPTSLETLIPEYLQSIPNTGMGAYPKYEYVVGEEAHKYDNNPWVLYIDTPSGGLNWDMFMYFPEQNYPKTGYGGWLEQIGDWAYVHE